jgi:hypothetical protein
MMYRIWFFLLISHVVSANDDQPAEPTPPAPSGSEVMLFALSADDNQLPRLSSGINISQSPGYDSQPRFSADGQRVYFTHFSDGQMDVHQYDLSSDQTTAYLVTDESEYSPTPVPGQSVISVVQVDVQGDQYLVLLDANRTPPRVERYADIKQVGYFNWTRNGYLWLFKLAGQGGDLYVLDTDKKPRLVTRNVGRSFITNAAADTLYFVDKNTTPWRIRAIHEQRLEVTDVMALPLGVEDFTLDSQGRLWAGKGDALYVSDDQQRWYLAHEFDLPGLSGISRLTTSPDASRLAVVFAEQAGKD